jgi:hypothetical protein
LNTQKALHSIAMLCTPAIYLRTNTEFCAIQHSVTDFRNRGGKCSLRGRNWVFNPLAYTAACEAVWATDFFAFSSSFLSVDGMICHIILKLKKSIYRMVYQHFDCIDF